MIIDNSRYVTVTGNFEKYRLVYENPNIVPEAENENLATGLWMHEFMHYDFMGITDKATVIAEVLAKGELTDRWADAGYGYFLVLREHILSRGNKRTSSEQEYMIPLEHGHFFAGRYDETSEFGITVVDEFKTWSSRRQQWEWEKEWKCAPQAAGLLLGSRHLGLDTQYIDVHLVIKDTPARVHTHKVERSEYELEYHKRALAQYCDMIECLKEKWGDEGPWPHQIPSVWSSDLRGACNGDWCEYKEICGMTYKHGCELPTGFKRRKEHLEVVREINKGIQTNLTLKDTI